MKLSTGSIPIAVCIILGKLIISYIIITVIYVFILLNKISLYIEVYTTGTQTIATNMIIYQNC